MELILWRHAEAEEGSDDLARSLTRRGRQQAALMAAWLRLRLPVGYQVIASEAKRSQQTAALLSKNYRVEAAINPTASVSSVLAAAGWPDAKTPIVLVGHQPFLGQLAASLLAGSPQMWSVKKGGVWWLSHRLRHDIPVTQLKMVMNPSMLTARDD